MGYPSNAVDWLTKLIGFNTVSRYSNLQLIEYVAGYCEQLGLSPRLTFNADNTKANLFVTVPAMGKGDSVTTGGFVFSGHTDVVPVDRHGIPIRLWRPLLKISYTGVGLVI